MSRQPADLDLLVDCARKIGLQIGVPAVDERHVREVISKVINGRAALDAAAQGVITREEAATLLLAHYQSDLFAFADAFKDADPWSDPALIDTVKRALFGPS
jgi:hypothetical protein